MKSGTWITTPFASVTGLVGADDVSPLSPSAASATFISMLLGSSIDTGLPSTKRMLYCTPSTSHLTSSPMVSSISMMSS